MHALGSLHWQDLSPCFSLNGAGRLNGELAIWMAEGSAVVRRERILFFCFLTGTSRNWSLWGLVRLKICKRECFSCDQAGYSQAHTLGFYQEQPEAPKQTALNDLWTGSVFPLLTLTYMLSEQVPTLSTLVCLRPPLISLQLDGLQLSLWFWFLKLPRIAGWKRPDLTRDTDPEQAVGG